MAVASDRLRTLRALARATASGRTAIVDGRRMDVHGLAFDGSRWVAAASDHDTSSLRIVDAERAQRVEVTRSRASAPPEGFDPRQFAWQRWLEAGGESGTETVRVDDDGLEIIGQALPVLRVTSSGAGCWSARIRTSDSVRLGALADSLVTRAEVQSSAMSPRESPPAVKETAETRLLRLAAWLLGQDEPVSRQQIYDEFPDSYRGKADAVEKKFSRDKDALRRLGYAIQTVDLGDPKEPVGYVLSARACRLPSIALAQEEAALVWSAGIGAARLSTNPLQEDLESALRKLVVGAQGVPPRAAALEQLVTEPPAQNQEKHLALLVEAWELRKRVTIDYWRVSSNEVVTRTVDVYGWARRRGEWIFVGHDSIRNGVRIFYLSRVRKLRVNKVRPQDPDYEIPKGFDIRRWSRQQTWDYDVHPPLSVTVRLRGSLAGIARSLVPGAATSSDVRGARILRFEVRNLHGLVRQVLAWGPEAELVEPEEGRAMAREILASFGHHDGRRTE